MPPIIRHIKIGHKINAKAPRNRVLTRTIALIASFINKAATPIINIDDKIII